MHNPMRIGDWGTPGSSFLGGSGARAPHSVSVPPIEGKGAMRMSRLPFLIRPVLTLVLVASAAGVVAAACGDKDDEGTSTPKATATKTAATGTAKASPTKAAGSPTTAAAASPTKTP